MRQKLKQFDCQNDDFVRALHDVYEEMEENGEKPGSEKWVQSTEGRREVLRRITEMWAAVTKRQTHHFPFNEDHVIRLFTGYRKLGEDDSLPAFLERYFGEKPIPPDQAA